MDKRLKTLQELYDIQFKEKKKTLKEERVCQICSGTGIDKRTLPSTNCTHDDSDFEGVIQNA